ncbi:FbpB family small basic protein [Fictibacillus sp. b24]|nr:MULTISPECIES: FbpB family small basic protein [Fictibacillus]MDM5316385.1 FbpB family small basic protein [Fictibacillus sp. b24]
MRKNRKMSFRELVNENKRQLLKDETYIEQLEKKIDERHTKNA